MTKSSASTLVPAETIDLEHIKAQLREAYPTATDKLLSEALQACQIELAGDAEPGRLIRCVCERITN